MKENKLSIIIERSVEEVFEFTTNPNNTHLWIDSIEEEVINTEEISVGTLYKNRSDNNQWDTYEVIKFVKNEVFILSSCNSSYVVEYLYEKIDNTSSKMTYYEYMKEGELSNPFEIETLEKLKKVIQIN